MSLLFEYLIVSDNQQCSEKQIRTCLIHIQSVANAFLVWLTLVQRHLRART